MKLPFLVGETIYLRELQKKDLNENYQQWFNDAEVCCFNSHHRFPNYKQDMQDYFESVIKNKFHLVLGIFDKKSDQHIGNISLHDIDAINKSAEFAIIIGNKDFWGKSIGKEAGKLIIKHGFDELNLQRIYCGTSAENSPMKKLAEYLGFIQEGVSRKALFKNGSYNDIISYGLLKDEYQTK